MNPRLTLFLALAAPLAAAETQTLFNGRTLEGWEGNPASWRVEDGAITGEIKAGEKLAKNEFIYWRGEAGDFELTLEFRLGGVPSANSGIQFRSRRLPDGHAAGYQADMDLGATWLGRIYEEHGRALLAERGIRVSIAPDGRRWTEPFPETVDYAKLMRPDGAWNTYRILATGPHLHLQLQDASALPQDEPWFASFAGSAFRWREAAPAALLGGFAVVGGPVDVVIARG